MNKKGMEEFIKKHGFEYMLDEVETKAQLEEAYKHVVYAVNQSNFGTKRVYKLDDFRKLQEEEKKKGVA